MNKLLLTVNAGSSSIKFSLFEIDCSSKICELICGQVDGINASPRFTVKTVDGLSLVDSVLNQGNAINHKQALEVVCAWLTTYTGDVGELIGIGHRVVHGGMKFSQPTLVNPDVLAELEALAPLAPLHQTHNVSAIRAFQAILPHVPQVACFDTAFHRSQPEVAQKYALPRRFFDEGICHYGFHGLSYEYIASVLPSLNPDLIRGRAIVAHLGNGASLCALSGGHSVATTMGFSPLDGLVMGTRCGSLDPGVILYLMRYHGMNCETIEHMLYYESGLLGVSGQSSDMRALQASTQPSAKEAIELFVYRIAREIGSLTAALGGLDALVFTGGIGENSAAIRAEICQLSTWQGIAMDNEANNNTETRISTDQSKVSVWVIKTNENLMIARHVLHSLQYS